MNRDDELENIKAIITNKHTAKAVKDVIDSFNEAFKANVLLLSFGMVDRFEDIRAKLDTVDEKMAPEPIVSRPGHTNRDLCLILWDFHGNIYKAWYDDYGRTLDHQNFSHDKTYTSVKREWTYQRNYDVFSALDEDQIICSKEDGLYLPQKRNVFLPFAALDGKRTVVFQTSTSFEAQNTKKSTSPDMHLKKPYDFKRPKISITMEQLDNAVDQEDDDSYETNVGVPGTSKRFQPNRNCKNIQKVSSDSSIDDSENESFEKFIDDAVESAVLNLQEVSTPGNKEEKVLRLDEEDSNNSEEIFSCDVCCMKFREESALESHMYNSSYCYDYCVHDN